MSDIRLNKINHRGCSQIAINSSFEKNIIEQIKTIPNVKWSKTHRCWYVKESANMINRIYNTLKGYASIDYSNLKTNLKQDLRQSKHTLSETNHKTLSAFTQKIKLKNYSTHTLKTYQNCFTVFLLYAQHISKTVGYVEKEEIEIFMMRWKEKKNPSASYQNQMINAIKFYYEQVEEKNRQVYNLYEGKKAKAVAESDFQKRSHQTYRKHQKFKA